MKLSSLQQSYLNRRSNSFRGSLPLDSSGEVSGKSPAARTFWLLLHAACCLVSVVIGFRFSRLVFLFLFSAASRGGGEISAPFVVHSALATASPIAKSIAATPANHTAAARRVVVGRHGIRVRPWPHPNPEEVMKAHRIIERVQREQRTLFGVKMPKTVIAVTPTHVRTFQKLHLSGVMHSLMLAPYEVVWIVVEAGQVTNKTASIIAKSGLRTIHVGFNHRMPISWNDRHKLEARMRLHALRSTFLPFFLIPMLIFSI